MRKSQCFCFSESVSGGELKLLVYGEEHFLRNLPIERQLKSAEVPKI